MNTYKSLLMASLVALLMVPAFAFVAVPEAQAACSVQGFTNSNGKCYKSFKHAPDAVFDSRIAAMEAYVERLQALIDLLVALRDSSDFRAHIDDDDDSDSDSDSVNDPDATTDPAQDVTEDSAELNGSVDMNDFNNGEVFFIYGEDEEQIKDVEDDFDTYSDIDEDGDNLQKVLVDADLDGSDDYAHDIDGLDPDTDYYFTICVGYEDEDNDDQIECGSVRDFTTGEDSPSEEPSVDTDDAENIDDQSAELNGSVDMNDFENGLVFFVWGTNETQIGAIADDNDTYDEVPDDQDALDKEEVDSDLDGSDDYTETVDGLESDTEYFYTICVEFENADEDDELICGDVERFVTES